MTGIYCIENNITHKKYVGLTKDMKSRWRAHRQKLKDGTHPNAKLLNAWRKYGETAFSFYVLEEVPKEQLQSAEIKWIKKLDTFHNGYNLTAGGDGQNERYLTAEERAHLSEINMGERNPNYGLKRSAETRQKMSLAMKKPRGPMSDAHKQAISKGNKGKRHPWFNKPVLWVETGQTFLNISEAASATGYSISGISKVCRGLRGAIYHQHFSFLEELKNEQN